MSFYNLEFLFVIPFLTLLIGALCPLFIKVFNGNKDFISQSYGFSFIGLVLSFGMWFLLRSQSDAIWSGSILFDPLAWIMGLGVIVLALGALLLSWCGYGPYERQLSEKNFLFLNVIMGLLLMITSEHFLTLFVSLEWVSLSLYVMIAMCREEKLSKEAAMKYFILGSVASAFFLFGIALVYSVSGVLSFSEFSQVVESHVFQDKVFLLGVTLILMALFFKLGLFPMHYWLPDVYYGAPLFLTLFMATAVKVGIFTVFLRFVLATSSYLSAFFMLLFQVIILGSIIVGTVAAIYQKSIKRLLVHSSVAHSGFLFAAILPYIHLGQDLFLFNSIFYLFIYLVASIGLFFTLFLLNQNFYFDLEDLKGFSQTNSFLAVCLVVFLFSFAGFPLFGGFWSKLLVFYGLFEGGFSWLLTWILIFSVAGLYLYLKPSVYMFFHEGQDQSRRISLSVFQRFLIGFLAVLILIIGVGGTVLYDLLLGVMQVS